MFLATLATLNFSLAFLIGLLAAPLSFVGQPYSTIETEAGLSKNGRTSKIIWSLVLQVLSPPVVLWATCRFWEADVTEVIVEAAFGWRVQGLWTQVVVWCVWWPAWILGGVICSPLM